jgi:dihydroorotase-like cyclic amidohydrolase
MSTSVSQGFEYKETIQSGTAAAVAGGFTTVCAMPNTNPVNDNQAVTEFMLERAKAAGNAHLYPIGAITKKSEGKELAEIGDLRRARLCRHFRRWQAGHEQPRHASRHGICAGVRRARRRPL